MHTGQQILKLDFREDQEFLHLIQIDLLLFGIIVVSQILKINLEWEHSYKDLGFCQ